MAKLEKDTANTTNNTARVINGAGTDPIMVEVKTGDTVTDVIKRAGVTLSKHDAVAIGKKSITNPGKTPADPNTTIVITGKIANG